MAPLCIICNKSREPKFFLISCISCSKSWHHRCHIPPIPDPELIAIIKAFNEERKHNPSAKLNWKCGACLGANLKTLSSSEKSRLPYNTKDDPIVIHSDSDDEVNVVEKSQPSKRPQKAATRAISSPIAKQITRKSADASVRVIDDPIAPLEKQRSFTTNVLTSGIGHLSVSDHQLREPRIPSLELIDDDGDTYSTPKPSSPRPARAWTKTPVLAPTVPDTELLNPAAHGLANRHSTPSSRPARTPQSPLLIEPSGSNTGPDVRFHSPESRPTLSPELLRQFQARSMTLTVRTPNPPGTSHQATPEPQFHPALLPHFINSRYRNGDIWHSAASRNSKARPTETSIGPDGESSASLPSSSRSPRSFSVRKRKFLGSVSDSTSMDTRNPFFFSADVWMKEKKDALALYEEFE